MVKQVNKGLQLKIMRLKAGIRQYELAARLGIHPSKLSEIESGRYTPSPELIDRLMQIVKGGEGGGARSGS
jgi:transcriptional regulator with XRE-family HTH domain